MAGNIMYFYNLDNIGPMQVGPFDIKVAYYILPLT
jgi:hypothetical protein